MRTLVQGVLASLVFSIVALTLVVAGSALAGDVVKSHSKISDTTPYLDVNDYFGESTCSIGDLDGDGVQDLAVGASFDNDGGDWRGAVWVLFLNASGTVKAHQKISDTEGLFTGVLDDDDHFGSSVCSVGDLNGDTIEDLAVGAPGDGDGGSGRGAVWVLFLNANGTVKAHQKISDTEGNFTGTLDNADRFGAGVCSPGDLDSDGVRDLAVGAHMDDDGGQDRGAVWMLFLHSDGTVKAHQKISQTQGGFTGTLDDGGAFGCDVCSLGDLDNDGVRDLAVGNMRDDDGGSRYGSVWVLFLKANGIVKAHQKISDTQGGFTGTLHTSDFFGSSVCSPGDLDGDTVEDLAVGSEGYGDGGAGRGAVWVLFLNANGTVKVHQKISSTDGLFTGDLDDYDMFGCALGSPGDLDGDGVEDLVAGAYGDDEIDDINDTYNTGAVWVLFLNPNGTVQAHQKISDTEGGAFPGALGDWDIVGSSVCSLGDLDNDGVEDLAVGAPYDADEGYNRGAVWVLFRHADGTARAAQKISAAQGGFTGILDNDDQFGSSVSSPGDLDLDGVEDLVVGAPYDDDGGTDCGAVWVLFLNTDATVKSHQKIVSAAGGYFGCSVCFLGHVDGDAVQDLAVGAPVDEDGGPSRGAVWVLFLNTDGTVRAQQKISDTQGGFTGGLQDWDLFGSSVSRLGDLNGDFAEDLAVGARGDDDDGAGAIWVLFLNTDGTVRSHQKISSAHGGFTGTLHNGDQFGCSVCCLGDLDGDMAQDLAVGAHQDSDGGTERGAVWVLYLDTDGTVKASQKISNIEGGFDGILDDGDHFGWSVCSAGDLDGDGVADLVAGAPYDDDGGDARGAIWMLYLDDEALAGTPSHPATGAASLQAFPNPSRGGAGFSFTIDREDVVTLAVYGVGGRLVRTLLDRRMEPGEHSAAWDGRDATGREVSSAIYFCRVSTGEGHLTIRTVLLR